MERERFYRRVVGELIERGLLLGSGRRRRRRGRAWTGALAGHGFGNVLFTNLDPAQGEVEDAESLSYADGSFDFGIVPRHSTTVARRHRALLELYRVSRVGVLVLEARDSRSCASPTVWASRKSTSFTVVAAGRFRRGGVANSAVPNYAGLSVDRARGGKKTSGLAAPERRHRFVWFRELELPLSILDATGKSAWRHGRWPLRVLVTVFSGSQANLFAFAALKDDLQPWMRIESEPDADEIRRRLLGHG